jgi:ATP-binding cassette subfamily B protein
LSYVRPYGRELALVLALSLVSTAAALYVPYLSKTLVDRALIGRDWASLERVVLLFAALSVASFALNVATGLLYTRASAEILFDMRLAVYRHLQRLSPRFYARTRLGDIVARLNNDIGEIQRVASEAALAWVGNALFLAGTIAMMAWLDWRLCLVALCFVPPSVWLLARYRSVLAARIARFREASAGIGSFLIETLVGMRLVVSSNAQEREAARFRERHDTFLSALLSMQRSTYLSGAVPGLILTAGSMVVFLYGGRLVIDGRITPGTFVAFLAYQMRLMGPLQGLMGLYASLATVKVSLRRVDEILDAPPDVVEKADAIPLPAARGVVSVEEVTVSHDRGMPVLSQVSFSAGAGERIALVGPSGSGKSTLADLLLRLIDPDPGPDAGRILLDGCDLRDLRLADVRRLVALVEQDPVIFHATIDENIGYARPGAPREAIEAAARAAGAAEFIERLPRRYDTIVGERGLALSAGERQRLAIARAFLADPAVLVLDEATAALDPIAEAQVVAGYEAVMRGRTTILISHRLQMALRADRAIVLRDGRVVEQGSPRALLDTPGSRLAALFEREETVLSVTS